jgi:hypothetical protein
VNSIYWRILLNVSFGVSIGIGFDNLSFGKILAVVTVEHI